MHQSEKNYIMSILI